MNSQRQPVVYTSIDSLNLNLGVKNDVVNVPNKLRYSKLLSSYRDKLAFVGDVPALLKSPRLSNSTKKTRSSGRITSLGQPGHGDATIVAKKTKKVNKRKPV